MKYFLKFFWACCVLMACEQASDLPSEENNNLIVIRNFTFVPQELVVTAGQTVFFVNEDTVPHHILSASDENVFEDSGDFESSILAVGETGSIEIPEDAEAGSVFFYYCDLLKETMATPNGSLIVE